MGNTSPSGRAWPWWTGTSCWSWWSVEKSHDHPHPDHQHARAVLCDRRHRVREHPGPGAKSIGLAEDPDVDDPRVRLRRIDRGDLPHRHLPPVRPVATMLLWQLILSQVITFVVLAFLLHQVLYRQVTRSLGRLQQLYQENREREEELKRKREETERELRTTMARHQEEIGRLRAEAEATARKMQEELLAQAKEEGRRIVADAEAKRERMRVSLVSEMEEKAVDLASDILGRVFTAPVAQSIHAHLIDELIEEIGKSDGPRPELETETVEVAVPFPLTQTQRERLNTIFSSNVARSVDVKEIIDGEIVAGMVVRLGNVVLDGSLKTKVKGMLAYVRESLSRQVPLPDLRDPRD